MIVNKGREMGSEQLVRLSRCNTCEAVWAGVGVTAAPPPAPSPVIIRDAYQCRSPPVLSSRGYCFLFSLRNFIKTTAESHKRST